MDEFIAGGDSSTEYFISDTPQNEFIKHSHQTIGEACKCIPCLNEVARKSNADQRQTYEQGIRKKVLEEVRVEICCYSGLSAKQTKDLLKILKSLK